MGLQLKFFSKFSVLYSLIMICINLYDDSSSEATFDGNIAFLIFLFSYLIIYSCNNFYTHYNDNKTLYRDFQKWKVRKKKKNI